jgi:serpin B
MPSLASPLGYRWALGALVLALSGACSAGDSGAASSKVARAASSLARSTAPSTNNVSALGASNAAFAFDLYHAVADEKPGANLVFSPYSVSTALAMAYEGARTSTESEMKAALHFELDKPALHEAFNATDLAISSRGAGKRGADGSPFRLNVNNSIWAQHGLPLVPTFLDALALNYGAGVFLTDFAGDPEGARAAINRWVSDETEQRIPELLKPANITGRTRLVLTNTIYLNAGWANEFIPASTLDAPFTRPDGSVVSSKMMNGTFDLVRYAEGDDYRAFELPYQDGDLSFLAVLPNEGGFDRVQAGLSVAWLDELQSRLVSTGMSVSVPRLDYTQNTDLAGQLRALGMITAFEPGADFSGMTPGVVISAVIHQAALTVQEGGTIAAAATAVIFAHKSAVRVEQTVRLDRPFLFAIVDRTTGAILFLGRVLDPTAQ